MHPAGQPGRFLSFGVQAILAAAAGITGGNTILPRTPVVGLILLGGMSMAPAGGDRDAGRGRELYARYCTGCHGVDGRGEAKKLRPNVCNLAGKEDLEQGADEYLFAAIKQGGVAVGKNAAMPAWDKQLDDGQIWD